MELGGSTQKVQQTYFYSHFSAFCPTFWFLFVFSDGVMNISFCLLLFRKSFHMSSSNDTNPVPLNFTVMVLMMVAFFALCCDGIAHLGFSLDHLPPFEKQN